MKNTIIYLLLLFLSCTDDEGNPCVYQPTLTTEAVTNITETSATLNGTIDVTSENCETPNNIEQGFVYSTEIQPTIEDTQVNVNGTSISTTIEGLEPNTTYYVRSFLTNAIGEFYGNEVEFITYIIPDTTPPVITIIGDNPLEINIGENYIEFGATAIDDIDGDITQDIIVDSSNINTSIVGNYNVTYSVSDLSNNSTSEVREVVVYNPTIYNCFGDPVPTIVYENKEWTVENACHTTYRDGTPIPQVLGEEIFELTTGAWCYVFDDPNRRVLYNWYAVAGIHDDDENTPNKEFAPAGWRVPTTVDFAGLGELYTAKDLASTSGWATGPGGTYGPGNNQSLNNSSGFNAFPDGISGSGSNSNNFFNYQSTACLFWTSEEYNPGATGPIAEAMASYLENWSNIFTIYGHRYKRHGLSVRLVKDN